MGTFGTFTDSTTPVASTTVSSGTLSIDVTQQGFTVPVTTSNFVPGDSLTRAVNLVNDGGSPLGSVTLALDRGAPEHPDHGRRPTACSWPSSPARCRGPRAAPPRRRPTPARAPSDDLGSGPAVSNLTLTGAASLDRRWHATT